VTITQAKEDSMASSEQDGAGSSAADAKEQAKETAQQAASSVRDRAREQIDQRSSEAGDRVGSLAGDLRQISEQLREQGNDGPANVGEQAAQRAERVGGYLRDSDPDTILRDVEDLGRRQPWLALAGGVVLGIAAARFLKASSSQRYHAQSSNGASADDRPERQPMPPPTGNLTASTPVSYGDSAAAEAAASDMPAVGQRPTPPAP
jgi:hypothetical protein